MNHFCIIPSAGYPYEQSHCSIGGVIVMIVVDAGCRNNYGLEIRDDDGGGGAK